MLFKSCKVTNIIMPYIILSLIYLPMQFVNFLPGVMTNGFAYDNEICPNFAELFHFAPVCLIREDCQGYSIAHSQNRQILVRLTKYFQNGNSIVSDLES